MPNDLLSTKEVAEYLGIHEKQVYALVKAGRIPATRLTGKWIFPRHLIDEWIEENARSGLKQAREKGSRVSGAVLASGSNDPLLDVLASTVRRTHPDWYLFSASIGSTAGLEALERGFTDIAWSHLWDADTDDWNVPFLKRLAPTVKAVVVTLWRRDLGFVILRGNPRGIGGFEELANEGVTFVNRQAGSGTRSLVDHHLTRMGIDPSGIAGYGDEVGTHFEVGLRIKAGAADVGIATRAVADMLDLAFVPLTRERFDMVMRQESYFGRPVQALLETLRTGGFQERVSRLGHYDFTESGSIVHAVS
jgi:excisionase family DNA binding protein